MSFIESGLSFIGLKDRHVSVPVVPCHNPSLPKKFEAVFQQALHNPSHLDIPALDTQQAVWTSPEAVSFLFAHLHTVPINELETILRKQRPIEKINGQALQDPKTMATVITTTARFDEEFDRRLSARDPNQNWSACDSKYFYTQKAIQRVNGLSQDAAFHQFLNNSVGFDTQPVFEHLRNSCHKAHSQR